jgi:hypothetical protein
MTNETQRTNCWPTAASFTVDGTDVINTTAPGTVIAHCADTTWALRIAGMLNSAALQGLLDGDA